ncbi:ABC transporter substrate-binding protein [Cellulomonas sp. C5510]|uniref:ABC transporter substrate-binding protein n=1 Tax=Cellulomonas sp. C5510 TaxID=2871170 RepID=UPI001C98486A|nr:ABC transporter substrate-binding protein [Cellulomonas sp. C5510]QZN87017.1 ABC transporter substrate-binding protein [Cellulomonas sp. C5510]
MHVRLPAAAVPGSLAAALALAGCAAAPGPAAAPPSAPGFPVTVENCGETVTFDGPPERVVLLETAPVTILDGLGVLDRVVARAGSFADGYYSPDLAARIAQIPALSDDLDTTGHVVLSQEVVIAQQPDLVLGLPDGTTRAGLADAGARVLEQPTFCAGGVRPTTFATLDAQIREYGAVFDRADEADDLVAALEQRVAAVEAEVAGAPGRTAAVLYPTPGGGPLYAYGAASMATPQMEAAGFTNVFAAVPDRVVEVSVEELVDRDPDVLVLLGQGDLDGLEDEVARLPGAEGLRALREGAVLTQLFNFTEPPSPLVVDGLERIAEAFAP